MLQIKPVNVCFAGTAADLQKSNVLTRLQAKRQTLAKKKGNISTLEAEKFIFPNTPNPCGIGISCVNETEHDSLPSSAERNTTTEDICRLTINSSVSSEQSKLINSTDYELAKKKKELNVIVKKVEDQKTVFKLMQDRVGHFSPRNVTNREARTRACGAIAQEQIQKSQRIK